MPRTGYDANLAALQASAALPGHVLDIVVLTADAGLLVSLREACGPQHVLWHAESAGAAVDLLVGGRCGILVADIGTLRTDAAPLLDRLHAQFPELLLTAAGTREEQATVANLAGGGIVQRFLPKPASAARAHQFLTAVTRQYAVLQNIPAAALTPARISGSRRIPGGLLAGGAVLLAAVIALGIWRFGAELSSVSPARVHALEPAVKQQINDHLARAESAYAEGRLIRPPGDNALEHFRAVLALQPDHARARQGIDLVVAALEARLTQALQSRDAAQGAAAFTALQRADPRHPRLEEFRAQLLSISRSAGRQIRQHPSPAANGG